MDVAFPVLSGQAGQGEPVQALLEAAGVPFVGPPASAAALRDRSRLGPNTSSYIIILLHQGAVILALQMQG